MLFKQAYARGVCNALGVLGLVKFANEEIAAQAADAAADTLPVEPVEPVAESATAELAADLIELSNQLEETAEQAAATAETASVATGEKMASRVAMLRRKLSAMGSTSDPDDPTQKNTEQNAAQVTGEGQMDAQARPPEYANVGEAGVGMQEASGEGAIGSEKERIDQDSKAVDKDNSAIDAIKGASVIDLIKKVAVMGSTLDPADASQRNTPAQAGSVTGEGQKEQTERPPNYALTGPGNSEMAAKMRASSVGTEQDNSAGNPVKTPGTNSPIEQIAKSAEHAEYLKNFGDVAHKFASFLPATASDDQKVNAIQFLMGQGPDERVKIANLIKEAGEIPAALKAYTEKKKKGDNEEDEEGEGSKKEEKKEKEEEKSEEKEAALKQTLDGLSKLAGIRK